MSLFSTLNPFVPSSCLLCNGYVRGLKPLCSGCEDDFPWNSRACFRCAMPLATANPVCADCLQSPPVFQRAFCAFRYEEPIAGLLNRYKHNGSLACGHWLAQGLADAIVAQYGREQIAMPDCVLPVPLHWRRLRSRGFDQGLEIGKVLARRLEIPLSTVLRRDRYTDSQQTLSREQRQRNLAGAFVLRRPLATRCVALVDDVLTTGSTANEISVLLQSVGIEEVHIWAIARTP
jgi:ComF family protein